MTITTNLGQPTLVAYNADVIVTKATIYRSPRTPDAAWSLGLGFDDWLVDLTPGTEAPTDAADEALAADGLRRVGDWGPHRRADWGWLEAHVEQKTDGEH